MLGACSGLMVLARHPYQYYCGIVNRPSGQSAGQWQCNRGAMGLTHHARRREALGLVPPRELDHIHDSTRAPVGGHRPCVSEFRLSLVVSVRAKKLLAIAHDRMFSRERSFRPRMSPVT